MTTPTDKLNGNKPAKKSRTCPRCKGNLDSRVPRGFFVKTFLFWLPIKRYICYKCHRKKYVWG